MSGWKRCRIRGSSIPTDGIVKITSSAICGSDLHLYEVLGPYMKPGDIPGHEPMGIVQELGAEVTNLAVGDRVVVPFNISCGHCFMCYPQVLRLTALGRIGINHRLPPGTEPFIEENPNSAAPLFCSRTWVVSHCDCRPTVHMTQCPQEMLNGTTTRSPTARLVTSAPSSCTMPISSWPGMSPGFMYGPSTSYRSRSEPQIADEVIFTMPSVGILDPRIRHLFHPDITLALPGHCIHSRPLSRCAAPSRNTLSPAIPRRLTPQTPATAQNDPNRVATPAPTRGDPADRFRRRTR